MDKETIIKPRCKYAFFMSVVLFTIINILELCLSIYHSYRLETLEYAFKENLNELEISLLKSQEHLASMRKDTQMAVKHTEELKQHSKELQAMKTEIKKELQTREK
ncbi:hypothetical protein [Helicobacter cetorum]|uniref:Uncharacterized protein n=1 Tax=Helicobacter cetorum (strain ATCC BAA-540 / CCUG 52418 / MIT 99-5656) TaxID=1163745 RepID=I0EQL0_HELCM|nr:hypothetical protein [Helicobacter cetorum]AFI05229.1 hypothetical protein HCD_00985 [Helicobacter cetorum MIT 99-5656]